MLFLGMRGHRVVAHDRRRHGRSGETWSGNDMNTCADDLAAVIEALDAVPPLMLKAASNPGGLPIQVFDDIRKGVLENRSQFFKDLTLPFYGFNRPGAKVSEALRDSFWLMGMQSTAKAAYDCIEQFSATDFTDDLKKIDVPTLIIHGDDDQIVPIGASGMMSAKLVPNATLRIVKGGPHGVAQTRPDEINAELLAFIQS
jgi:non-heme chloroperoxidase